MQHLKNCSCSTAYPHVVLASSCRWVLPSMRECCLWWFECNSIHWKITYHFYQSNHTRLPTLATLHAFWRNVIWHDKFHLACWYLLYLISEFRAVGNSEWPVNHKFTRQIFALILLSAALSNIINIMARCQFSTKPLSGLKLTCQTLINVNHCYTRKLIVKCCLQKLAILFKPQTASLSISIWSIFPQWHFLLASPP